MSASSKMPPHFGYLARQPGSPAELPLRATPGRLYFAVC
jgi:hypothetical protein